MGAALTFDDYVTDYRETCEACLTQYEGTLKDGRRFYFRYRFAKASLGFGETDDEAVHDSFRWVLRHSDEPYDGYVSEDEFKELFVQLVRVREEEAA